ncbi:MAG: hypothetical protein V4857_15780 [Pseudomonadota bacterium]
MKRIFCKALVLLSVSLSAVSAVAADRALFDNLDYGVYWFGGQVASQKAVPGVANPYYGGSRPTVIYVHGWQRDKTPLLYRETFDRSSESGISQDLTAPWKRDGWNMGIFYWNQFADEGDVKDAEAKIWTTAGNMGMRWRKADGTYVSGQVNQTAAQLMLASYASAMAGYTGNNIRLVGHSLGSQMVVVTAKLISDAVDRGELPANLRPNRVVLLDPAFIGDPRSWLNNGTTGQAGLAIVQHLRTKGVIFESLATSGVASAADIKTIMNETAYREFKPWYFGGLDVVGKHMAAVWTYWWEYAYAPRPLFGSALPAASASSSNAAVQTHMNSANKMVHDQGAWTKTPGDDTYKPALK